MQSLVKFLETAKIHFDLTFTLKVVPNVTTKDGKKHLYGLLFRDHDDKNSFTSQLDPRDIEPLLTEFRQRVNAPLKLEARQIMYDGAQYFCIYLDIDTEKKDPQTKQDADPNKLSSDYKYEPEKRLP